MPSVFSTICCILYSIYAAKANVTIPYQYDSLRTYGMIRTKGKIVHKQTMTSDDVFPANDEIIVIDDILLDVDNYIDLSELSADCNIMSEMDESCSQTDLQEIYSHEQQNDYFPTQERDLQDRHLNMQQNDSDTDLQDRESNVQRKTKNVQQKTCNKRLETLRLIALKNGILLDLLEVIMNRNKKIILKVIIHAWPVLKNNYPNDLLVNHINITNARYHRMHLHLYQMQT